MSAPHRKREKARPGHIHLPSVHVRTDPGAGFDYEEDLYIQGRGRKLRVDRVVRLVVLVGGNEVLVRGTFDVLCAEEWEALQEYLPVLMEEGNPEANAIMEECARKEYARQLRIAAGQEQACHRCGCSETRACSGGCIWVSETHCSRCI